MPATRRVRRFHGCLASLIACAIFGKPAIGADAGYGYAPFAQRNDPPPYRELTLQQRRDYDFGHAVFNTSWVPAGTPGAGRRVGLGPLFNAPSCDACHNEGARGRGPVGDGPAPAALVIQLQASGGAEQAPDAPDPVYGHVLNPVGAGMAPEGEVRIEYGELEGRYADGEAWRLRVPHYRVSALNYGALAVDTVIKPRMAPALFGVGLLQQVAQSDIDIQADAATSDPGGWWHHPPHGPGRFGWQASAVSIRDQTTRAMSREMGLTSEDVPHDDCTPAQSDCLRLSGGDRREVSEALLQPLVSFMRWLAVPAVAPGPADTRRGSDLFAQCRCTSCHRRELPVMEPDERGVMSPRQIRPYTDLWLHDMGQALADRDLRDRPVPGQWRTAPLWGIGYALRVGRDTTFLHDGRARSVEEAVLWHGGEAESASACFQALPHARRRELLDWLESL